MGRKYSVTVLSGRSLRFKPSGEEMLMQIELNNLACGGVAEVKLTHTTVRIMTDIDGGGPSEGTKQYVTENTYILEPEGYGEVSPKFVHSPVPSLCSTEASILQLNSQIRVYQVMAIRAWDH